VEDEAETNGIIFFLSATFVLVRAVVQGDELKSKAEEQIVLLEGKVTTLTHSLAVTKRELEKIQQEKKDVEAHLQLLLVDIDDRDRREAKEKDQHREALANALTRGDGKQKKLVEGDIMFPRFRSIPSSPIDLDFGRPEDGE